MSSEATPEDFKIYHIFLASPGDMAGERQMVREFFERYNRNAANPYQLEFKVIDWENYSSIGLGRPQELITRQTLEKFKNSLVLFIGLLGQRFGTPTGGYDSGTEEEFETVLGFRATHREYPEIKWFFREQWGNVELSTDPEIMLEVTQQLKKVKAFKARLQTDGPQCFTASFQKNEQFQETFQQDKERWLNDPSRPWQQSNPPPPVQASIPASSPHFLEIWFKHLKEECIRLPLEKLEVKVQQGQKRVNIITLPDIFVPLKAAAPTKEWLESPGLNRQLAREQALGESGEPEDIMGLLNTERLSVVIGDPGSGKSTLINYLTWSLFNDQENMGESLKARTPVRIILRQVDIPHNAKQGLAAWLWNALAKDIKAKLFDDEPTEQDIKAVVVALRQKLMQPPYGLVMLDGLDEVSAADQRRSHLLQAIQALVTELPNTRFIITARPYAYTDPCWRLKDFTAFFLVAFDQEQRALFINRWYQAARHRYLLNSNELTKRIADLIGLIEDQRHITELAERPFLLTLISSLHAGGGRLPEDRAELYETSINLLLYDWRQESFLDGNGQLKHLDENLLRKCLQSLAYKSHQAQQRQPDATHTADISRDSLLEAFDPLIEEHGRKDLINFLQQHTGILIARDQNSFAFPHRSFQEYLAMGYLTAQKPKDLYPEVWADPLWWREVFLLAVIEQKPKNQDFASYYIQNLLKCGKRQTDQIINRLYILSALALNELDIEDFDDLTVEVQEGLKKIIQTKDALNVSERAEAGRALAAIGDNRPGVGLNAEGWPDIEWRPIPAGDVALEDKAGSFSVAAFHLAKYPVTNAQFQSFIKDPDGYANPHWWKRLDAEPGTPATPRWTEVNHPRETISWFEAMAFCAWLSERLDLEITLPTERQWQQAACSGKAGYDYPWGKDYQTGTANINETWDDAGTHYLQRTTAVGLYPQGDSLQGVADLSGNVWEWCLNEYEQPANKQASGSLARVVRGGSWLYGRGFARASCRGSGTPGGRYSGIGFRVCCLSPII